MKRFLLMLNVLVAVVLAPFAALGVTARDGVGYSGSGNSDRRPLHWFDGLKMLDPELTPFVQLLMKLDKVSVSDVKYNHFEDDDRAAWTQVNNSGGYTNSDTSIVVDDGTVFSAGYRVMVARTREVMHVSSVSTNTLTVTRAAAGSTAAAILDNDYLLVVGNRVYEGDTLPNIKTTVPSTVYNYTQLFREPYGSTGTNEAIKKRGGPGDLDRDRVIAMREFKKQIERAFRWGWRNQSGSGATTERQTGGLEYFVTTNVFNMEGALSKPELFRIVEATSRYGSANKLWLCGREARVQIDNLGLEGVNVSAKDNDLGIAIRKISTSFGEVNLVTDHCLEFGFADRIHIVDPTNAKMAVLRGVQHLTDRQAPDYDGFKNEFMAEVGLWLVQEKSHGIVKNVISTL